MKVNSKEKFIKLLVSTMVRMGYLIESFDFERDLVMMMSIDKYNDLFYFFDDISDFDFTSMLSEMQRDGLIRVSVESNKTKVEILNKLFYTVSDQILSNFDDNLIRLMEEMIRELTLSKNLSEKLPNGVNGIYRLTNPNRVYNVSSSHSIVTDGMVVRIDNEATGACIVQSANFVFLQRFLGGKLSEVQLFHKFEDQRYLFTKLKEILEFYRYLSDSHENKEEFSHFEKIKDINGYRYKKY